MNRSSLWLPDTFTRYKDIEMRSTRNLVDRLIAAQPHSTLKGIMMEYSDLSILKTETEVRHVRLEAEIAEIDRDINEDKGDIQNRDTISQLNEDLISKKNVYDELARDIEKYNSNLKTIDEKLTNQTVVEKRRIDRGWESEKECAKLKNEYSRLLNE